jgi:hypothetical protein
MASYNDKQNANNPLWDKRTTTELFPLTGNADLLSGRPQFGNPSYIIISNNGTQPVYVSNNAGAAAGEGIALLPGAAFETALGEDPTIVVRGIAAQTVYCVYYS